MRIIIIDTYYSGFLRTFWKTHSKLQNKSYSTQLQALLSACFGTSDYYSYNLKKLGHQATDIVANDEISQFAWAKEHHLPIHQNKILDRLRQLPYVYKLIGRSNWIDQIVLAQVAAYHPDVVYLQDLSVLSPKTLRQLKTSGCLLVGQIACPLPSIANLREFDLILTSFPHYVTMFNQMGIRSEYFKIGFESRLLKAIPKQARVYDVTFIGSFSPYHLSGTKVLETVARHVPIHVWGQGLEFLSPRSPLRKHYHGEAWGRDMYQILASSKIVINRHISSALNNANNMRLYESTGMEAMLITDTKSNLSKLFKVGKELVSYKDSQDLIGSLQYYLENPAKRTSIAQAGQERTLKEHTYTHRMQELSNILAKYL